MEVSCNDVISHQTPAGFQAVTLTMVQSLPQGYKLYTEKFSKCNNSPKPIRINDSFSGTMASCIVHPSKLPLYIDKLSFEHFLK